MTTARDTPPTADVDRAINLGPDPDDVPRVAMCQQCHGPAYICELPDSTCRFAAMVRERFGSNPAGFARLLREVEDSAWERLSVARTRQLESLTAERDRLRAALEWYAAAWRYDPPDYEAPSEADLDAGKRAREALGR